MNLIKWTGNPFVDCGIAATLAYCQKENPIDLNISDFDSMRNLLLEVYPNGEWLSNFYSIFVNHPINQSAYNLYEVVDSETKEVLLSKVGKVKANNFIKGKDNVEIIANISATKNKKKTEFTNFLNESINNLIPLGEQGNCIACGQRNVISRKNRQHIPLTGSGAFINFFSFAVNGADYCEVCSFLVQCSPLLFYVCGGARFLVIHSSSEEIKKIWANKSIENVNTQISTNNFTGCFNEGFSNAQNALFHITSEIVKKMRRIEDKNISISLYHFSNFGQSPSLDVYEMPSPVFSFVRKTQLDTYREDWQRIVRRGFFFRQKEKQIPLNAEKITDEDFKSKKNAVYLDLLEGKSIIPRFFNRRERKVYSDFALLRVYLKEVLFMNDQRIETIKKVADEIAEFIKQSPKGKRRLRDLEISVKFREFCNTLRKISKERLEFNPDNPLFTFDEFAKELFPEGSYQFGDTRYLILFRLYEKLHEWLKEQEDIAKDEDKVKEIEDKADLEDLENE